MWRLSYTLNTEIAFPVGEALLSVKPLVYRPGKLCWSPKKYKALNFFLIKVNVKCNMQLEDKYENVDLKCPVIFEYISYRKHKYFLIYI